MSRAPSTDDHEAERVDLEAVEQLASRERGLRRQLVGPADEEDAVGALREHLAVDQPEERRPVEEDVVVVGLPDLLEEPVERVAREQLGRIAGLAPAGEDVRACRSPCAPRSARRSPLASPLRAPVEHFREAWGLGDVEELVQPRPAHVRRDEPRPLAGLREDEPERRRHFGLALAVERARHEHDRCPVAGSIRRREACSVWYASYSRGAHRVRLVPDTAPDVRDLGRAPGARGGGSARESR